MKRASKFQPRQSMSAKALAKKAAAPAKKAAVKKAAPKKAPAKKATPVKKAAVKKAAVKKAAPAKKAAPVKEAAERRAAAPVKEAPATPLSARRAPASATKTRAVDPRSTQANGGAPRARAMKPRRRADFGAPVEEFVQRQPPPLRAIVEQLRELIAQGVPEAVASLKWGMPFYSLDGEMMCAIGGHKAHVNLILSGPPGTFHDPDGRLEGEGNTGRHLRLTDVEQLPRDLVRGWLQTAAALARARAK